MRMSHWFAAATFSTTIAASTTNIHHVCLHEAEVDALVSGFSNIIAVAPTNQTLARQVLAENFTSVSDGVNFVDGVPLNTTLTHSLDELLAQEAALPSAHNITDLFISFTCDTITWYFSFDTEPLPTRGIAILFVATEWGGERKIYKAYREVNSAAVLYNLGKPECRNDFKEPTVGVEGLEKGKSSCQESSKRE